MWQAVHGLCDVSISNPCLVQVPGAVGVPVTGGSIISSGTNWQRNCSRTTRPRAGGSVFPPSVGATDSRAGWVSSPARCLGSSSTLRKVSPATPGMPYSVATRWLMNVKGAVSSVRNVPFISSVTLTPNVSVSLATSALMAGVHSGNFFTSGTTPWPPRASVIFCAATSSRFSHQR